MTPRQKALAIALPLWLAGTFLVAGVMATWGWLFGNPVISCLFFSVSGLVFWETVVMPLKRPQPRTP